jgi:hypothetical protein
MVRRHGLIDALGKSLRRSFYSYRDDAIEHAREKASVLGDDIDSDELVDESTPT